MTRSLSLDVAAKRQVCQFYFNFERIIASSEIGEEDIVTLGAEGVLPGRHIVSLLRVFKQFTRLIPSG
jgi:hypothetical protein